VGVHGQSVDEGNYDILDVDRLLELGTRLEEGIERLKVKLIRKNLERKRERERGREYILSLVDIERYIR
jgi:hypothetical protein